MSKDIMAPSDVKDIQVADHEQVAQMNESVLDVNRQLNQSNVELELLNQSLYDLKKTLDRNEELKSVARARMQKLVTRLV